MAKMVDPQTATARYWYQDGLDVREGSFEVPSSSGLAFPSCYVFAFPKSGSVFLNDLVTGLMREAGVPTVAVSSFLFANGISENSVVLDLRSIFQPEGYCYLGFRNLFPALRGNLQRLRGPKVLLVRDPRDMLVSYYYSLKFSHTYPVDATAQFDSGRQAGKRITDQGLDEFCLACAEDYNQLLREYGELLDNGSVHIFRYEDVIFRKAELARTLCGIFSLEIGEDRLKEIVAPLDIVPGADQPHRHVRQVHPGDHQRKLQRGTIRQLDATLGEFLARFGYPAKSSARFA